MEIHSKYLPNDVWNIIFTFVGPETCASTLPLVCKDWEALSSRESLWKNFLSLYETEILFPACIPLHWRDMKTSKQIFCECRVAVSLSPEKIQEITDRFLQGRIGEDELRPALNVMNSPAFWTLHGASANGIFSGIRNLLQHHDKRMIRIQSDDIYHGLFRSVARSVECLGFREPQRYDFCESSEHVKMGYAPRERGSLSQIQCSILVPVAVAAQIVIALAPELSIWTKLAPISLISLLCLPVVTPWTFSTFPSRIFILMCCHQALQWPVAPLRAILNVAPVIVLNQLAGVSPIWAVHAMFGLGLLTHFIPTETAGHPIIWRAAYSALLAPSFVGFILDSPVLLFSKLRYILPVHFPGLARRIYRGILFWNRHISRLGFLWALHAGNLLWTTQVDPSVLKKRFEPNRSLIWTVPRRPHTGIAISLMSLFGGFISILYGLLIYGYNKRFN